MPNRASNPTGLVPDSVPIDLFCVILTTRHGDRATCSLPAAFTGVAIFTDALAVVPVAFSATSTVVRASLEFTGSPKEALLALTLASVLRAATAAHAVTWTIRKLAGFTFVRVGTAALSCFDLAGATSIASVLGCVGIQDTVGVRALLILATVTGPLVLAVAASAFNIANTVL